MRYFKELGRAVETAFRRANFDSKALTDIATDALRAMRPCDNTSPTEILSWVMQGVDVPQQRNPTADFGQPPVTVYSSEHFYIEVLYWATTSVGIHQHAFSGAFAVLDGSSLHTIYTFDVATRVNSHMLVGDLSVRDVTVLHLGDVEPIKAGHQFIHSVFHLDIPSVTVVIRTIHDQDANPPFTYHYPHLALDSEYAEGLLAKQQQVLALCRSIPQYSYEDMATKAIADSDLLTAYVIISDAFIRLRQPSVCAELGRLAARQHGRLISILSAVAEESARRTSLAHCKTLLLDPDERVFIALLLMVPSRSHIWKFLQERYPDDDVHEKVVALTCRLAPHIFGADFNEIERWIYRCLVDDVAIETIFERLTEQHGAAGVAGQANAITAFCHHLQRSAVKPLLSNTVVAAL